jgi:hypothetical protein
MNEPPPYWEDICPVCKTKAISGCRCRISERTCKNGHTWYWDCGHTVLGSSHSKKTMNAPQLLRREIHPAVRVIDEKTGIVEYVASDESLDSYNEIVRADGARFNRFAKNAPFVDSHNYETIGNCLGKVLDYLVVSRQVVETVKWAIDVGDNVLANWGFKMTAAGYLKAVSIGFMPVDYVTKWDSNPSAFQQALKDMNVPSGTDVRAIYLEWEQLELSACVVGANPNAVAKAYKAGILDDAALERISAEHAKRETASSTDSPDAVLLARRRAQERFLLELQLTINQI